MLKVSSAAWEGTVDEILEQAIPADRPAEPAVSDGDVLETVRQLRDVVAQLAERVAELESQLSGREN